MATYTPVTLIGPAAALTATVTYYTSPASTNGIVRTISAVANTTAITFTISLGADGAGTRIISGQALTQAQVFVLNGWWVTAQNSANALGASSNATGTNCVASVSGYQYG